MNPSFDLWQRGTSFVGIANDTYFADRFFYLKSGAMVHDINRSTDVPTVAQSKFQNSYSAFLNVTTLDAAIDSGDFTTIGQKIEGYNFRKVAGKYLFVSFWVKATKVGTYCVAFRNSATDRSYVEEYTVNAANVWELKTIRLRHDPTGTWDYINGIGLFVTFALAAGTTYQTTPGSWQAGSFIATANQVNATDAVNNEFRIAQVQLHGGIDEIPFHQLARDIQTEKELAFRYYLNYTGLLRFCARNDTTTSRNLQLFFPTEMRTTPIVTLGTAVNFSGSPTVGNIHELGAIANGTASGSGLSSETVGFTADAEL